MIPEQERQLLQFDNMRKQQKIEGSQMSRMIRQQDLYEQKQRRMLSNFLHSLKDYPKITAVMIEHQHKSISTLPEKLREMFPELKERVERSIECCKKNAELLERVRVGLEGVLRLGIQKGYDERYHRQHQQQHEYKHQQQSQEQQNPCQHSHSHTHPVNPNKLINIFYHLCRQYSSQPIHKKQQFYIEFVRTTIKEYINQSKRNKLEESKNNSIKTLVVGSGMGRSLIEIRRVYQQEKEDNGVYMNGEMIVQGHEQDSQHYLLAQYLLNHHNYQQSSTLQFYPYIHNFSNHLSQQTPYKSVTITFPQHAHNNSNKTPYPMTFGRFNKLYKFHSQQWNVIVTQFYNYSIADVLLHIQLIYKLLKNNGIWIDISTSSFENHIVPYMSYKEYEKILDKSQFTLISKFNRKQLWYQQPDKLIKQWRKVYYRVMTKKSSPQRSTPFK